MSEWLRLTNDLKRLPIGPLLTPSQRAAMEAMQALLCFPGWFNLHGPPGSGKTLLARALASAHGAAYCVLPDHLNMLADCSCGVVIDNSPSGEPAVRRLLAQCELLEISTVVLVTRQPTDLAMRRVHLGLPQSADIAHVTDTLARLAYPVNSSRLPALPNLWNILQASLVYGESS